MFYSRSLFALVASASLSLLPVHGQLTQPPMPVEVQVDGVAPLGVVLPGAPANAVSAPGATNAPAAQAKTPEQMAQEKQLQDLLKLQFDRRPQAILQALAKAASPSADMVFTNDVLRFQNNVVAGNWKAAGEFLAKLPEAQRPQVYKHLLSALQRGPQPGMPQGMPQGDFDPNQPQQPQGPMPPVQPVLLPEDVLALAEIAPAELSEENVEALGRLLSRSLSKGSFIDPFLARLEKGIANVGGEDPKKRELAVKLLVAANRLTDAGRLLPQLDAAIQSKDVKTLDLHARFLLAIGRERQQSDSLVKAWEMTQLILAEQGTNIVKEREQALNRALELMPLISGKLGTNWLRESFQKHPEYGMAILASVGSQVSQPTGPRDPETRRKHLESQKRVVDELLAFAGGSTRDWESVLNVLVMAWMQEGEITKTRFQSRRGMQPRGYDMYGNPMFFDGGYYPQQNNPNEMQPIAPEQILPTAPSELWLSLLHRSIEPRVRLLIAELFIKAEQELKALPHLEVVAAMQPKAALNVANELIRSWSRTKDPNQQQQMYGPRYYPMYYGMQTTGTPLTRSMQVRNMKELAELLKQLRALPIGPLDEKSVVGAFTAAHSQAEVFRVEDIESVFGPMKQMHISTLAELLQTMRQRLAGQWRNPAVQQTAKTKRTDKDIEDEVMRGYELVSQLIKAALDQQPNEWRLHLVSAAATYDWAEFDYGKKVDLAIYTEKRDRAFKEFEKAAELYGSRLSEIEEKDHTPLVYQQWFNATLGASDLAYITRQTEPATNHLAKIRAAIITLPPDAVERHLAAFGKALGESANSLKPELKPRYLRSGLKIVGEHESALEARKLVTYYDDLLQEIHLDVRVDGDTTVGHGQPFGIFISLRHTEAVGRETGGFGKYLQNQQNLNYYYNPYGTPPVNHREDFEKQVREKLGEGFDVMAVTFNDDKAQSRGYGRPGWREFVLAYVTLKSKDGAVDKIPPLQMDLDFFDRRGQVILPTESQVVLIDARPDKVAQRPVTNLSVLQILDDRELASGKLSLEIKATAHGIIPELKDMFDTNLPSLKLAKFEDQGLVFSKIDWETNEVAAVCERSWLLSYVPETSGEVPARFQFPKGKVENVQLTYKRYADADLIEVNPEVALAGLRLRPAPWWRWPLVALGAAGLAALLALRLRKTRSHVEEQVFAYAIPPHITPFSVLSLLRRMERDSTVRLSEVQRGELARTIGELEKHYFAPNGNGSSPELERLARQWVSQAR